MMAISYPPEELDAILLWKFGLFLELAIVQKRKYDKSPYGDNS